MRRKNLSLLIAIFILSNISCGSDVAQSRFKHLRTLRFYSEKQYEETYSISSFYNIFKYFQVILNSQSIANESGHQNHRFLLPSEVDFVSQDDGISEYDDTLTSIYSNETTTDYGDEQSLPSLSPSTNKLTLSPTIRPSALPTAASFSPSSKPTSIPSVLPTVSTTTTTPSAEPSAEPSSEPSFSPSRSPMSASLSPSHRPHSSHSSTSGSASSSTSPTPSPTFYPTVTYQLDGGFNPDMFDNPYYDAPEPTYAFTIDTEPETIVVTDDEILLLGFRESLQTTEDFMWAFGTFGISMCLLYTNRKKVFRLKQYIDRQLGRAPPPPPATSLNTASTHSRMGLMDESGRSVGISLSADTGHDREEAQTPPSSSHPLVTGASSSGSGSGGGGSMELQPIQPQSEHLSLYSQFQSQSGIISTTGRGPGAGFTQGGSGASTQRMDDTHTTISSTTSTTKLLPSSLENRPLEWTVDRQQQQGMRSLLTAETAMIISANLNSPKNQPSMTSGAGSYLSPSDISTSPSRVSDESKKSTMNNNISNRQKADLFMDESTHNYDADDGNSHRPERVTNLERNMKDMMSQMISSQQQQAPPSQAKDAEEGEGKADAASTMSSTPSYYPSAAHAPAPPVGASPTVTAPTRSGVGDGPAFAPSKWMARDD